MWTTWKVFQSIGFLTLIFGTSAMIIEDCGKETLESWFQLVWVIWPFPHWEYPYRWVLAFIFWDSWPGSNKVHSFSWILIFREFQNSCSVVWFNWTISWVQNFSFWLFPCSLREDSFWVFVNFWAFHRLENRGSDWRAGILKRSFLNWIWD